MEAPSSPTLKVIGDNLVVSGFLEEEKFKIVIPTSFLTEKEADDGEKLLSFDAVEFHEFCEYEIQQRKPISEKTNPFSFLTQKNQPPKTPQMPTKRRLFSGACVVIGGISIVLAAFSQWGAS